MGYFRQTEADKNGSRSAAFRLALIVGVVMLAVGIGIGYRISLARLFLDTRELMREMESNVVAGNSEVKVRVYAKQYSWHFHYPGRDGMFGATAFEAITEENLIGLDDRDPAAADDFVSNELVLPCQKTVALILTSADVIHAIGHLEGDFEQDAIPGTEVMKALETPRLPRDGQFTCVQLCGPSHADHHAPYRFIMEGDFDRWSSEQSITAEQGN